MLPWGWLINLMASTSLPPLPYKHCPGLALMCSEACGHCPGPALPCSDPVAQALLCCVQILLLNTFCCSNRRYNAVPWVDKVAYALITCVKDTTSISDGPGTRPTSDGQGTRPTPAALRLRQEIVRLMCANFGLAGLGASSWVRQSLASKQHIIYRASLFYLVKMAPNGVIWDVFWTPAPQHPSTLRSRCWVQNTSRI